MFGSEAVIEETREKGIFSSRAYDLFRQGQVIRFVDLLGVTAEDLEKLQFHRPHLTPSSPVVQEVDFFLGSYSHWLPRGFDDWVTSVYESLCRATPEQLAWEWSKVPFVNGCPYYPQLVEEYANTTLEELKLYIEDGGKFLELREKREFRQLGAYIRAYLRAPN